MRGTRPGETFNFDGKTDILIRKDGKNVFIAECKFWKGEKAFLETADIAPKHANFKRDLGKSDESTFRYVFGQPGDANREIMLTVMAFDIPTARAEIREA
jgi:hypothetical protein